MATYHLELRQFPRSFTRFNLAGPEIGTIAMTWVQQRILKIDEQNWNPIEATITIIEGPSIPVERLSMGRGWTTALREGENVTERVLGEAREALGAAAASARTAATAMPGTGAAGSGSDPLALGVELGGLLGPDAARLLGVWRGVAARSSGLAPSESLALAERELAADRPG